MRPQYNMIMRTGFGKMPVSWMKVMIKQGRGSVWDRKLIAVYL